MENTNKVVKLKERNVNIPLVEETLTGQYGEFKRYRIGKMYIQPCDIKGEKVKIRHLAKHIEKQEKELNK